MLEYDAPEFGPGLNLVGLAGGVCMGEGAMLAAAAESGLFESLRRHLMGSALELDVGASAYASLQ